MDALEKSCDLICKRLHATKNPNLAKGILKFSKRISCIAKSTAMHFELTTALFNFGASELRKTGKRKKNKVQPNRKRKSANVSHQAVSKGSAEKRKQSKILILNVLILIAKYSILLNVLR